jgi:hypothetical protein
VKKAMQPDGVATADENQMKPAEAKWP